MSPFPRKGFDFQKIGTVENNKISFTFNGDNYKFVSTSPVLGSGGKWNVWVLHDSEYRSTFQLSPSSPYEYGAADSIESLFKGFKPLKGFQSLKNLLPFKGFQQLKELQ